MILLTEIQSQHQHSEHILTYERFNITKEIKKNTGLCKRQVCEE